MRLVREFNKVISLELAEFNLQEEVDAVPRHGVLQPCGPDVVPPKKLPCLCRQAVPRRCFDESVAIGRVHVVARLIDSVQETMAEEMPWVRPGFSENLPELFFLLGPARIHLPMNCVSCLVGISGGAFRLSALFFPSPR